MTFALLSWFILPLWCALFALYFILRREKLFRQSLIAKCAGTFLAVTSAGIALSIRGVNPLGQPVFWFFLLCMVADALLELNFVLGMLVFGCAHVCLIVQMTAELPWSWQWSLGVWAAAMVAGVFLFRRELPSMGLQAVPCCLYVAVLSGSLAVALPLPVVSGNMGYLPLALGLLFFFISDMMVAKDELRSLSGRYQKPIMLLYWLALYLIAAWLW